MVKWTLEKTQKGSRKTSSNPIMFSGASCQTAKLQGCRTYILCFQCCPLKVQESLDEKPSCLSRQATKEAMRSKGSVWDQNAWWVASTQTKLTRNIRVPVVVKPGLIFHAQISQKHIQTPALYIKCKKPSCLRWLWSVSTWLSLSWKECSHWIRMGGEKKHFENHLDSQYS